MRRVVGQWFRGHYPPHYVTQEGNDRGNLTTLMTQLLTDKRLMAFK